jgi:hypothetical protein
MTRIEQRKIKSKGAKPLHSFFFLFVSFWSVTLTNYKDKTTPSSVTIEVFTASKSGEDKADESACLMADNTRNEVITIHRSQEMLKMLSLYT